MNRKEIATCNSCLEVFDADKCVDENRLCIGNVPTCPYCKSDDLTFTVTALDERSAFEKAIDETWKEKERTAYFRNQTPKDSE